MNTTLNVGEPPNSTTDTQNPNGSVPYGLGFLLIFIFLLITLCYGSYLYKRSMRSTRSPQPPIIYSVDGRLPEGLADEVLVTFPTIVYSEAMMTQKGDDSRDVDSLGCSICLADYKGPDVLRMLPGCGHMFHVSCIDPWLKAHPTCPVCRDSPLPVT